MVDIEQLVSGVLAGHTRALARMLTIVENRDRGADQALAALFPHTGKAWVIGVTGAPGTGKSSLVNALVKAYRQRDQVVAIIAVDPTSPFSGGAILGDRIRMSDLSGDSGVFIRSMATRGSLGGLARATRDAIRVMDAAGFDVIFVETVGAGQSEVDIARAAYTTLVVEAPGLGDDVQAIKAGILEIADILVVNKADRPGADRSLNALKAMLASGHPARRDSFISHHGRRARAAKFSAENEDHGQVWIPPILKTTAIDGTGIEELFGKIKAHRQYMRESNRLQQLECRYLELELYDRLKESLVSRMLEQLSVEGLAMLVSRIQDREIDPQTAAQEILETLGVCGERT